MVHYELWDLMAELNLYADLLEIAKTNVAVQNFLLQPEHLKELGGYRDSEAFLLKFKKWEYLGCRSISRTAVLQKIYDDGGEEFLYDLQAGEDFLLENGHYKCFIDHKNWVTLAQRKLYNLIDWDDFGERMFSYNIGWEYAVRAQKWDILARYHKHGLLFVHGRFYWWFKSFSH